MTLQDSLKEFAPYNIDIKMMQGWLIVGMTYKKSWQILKPLNELIEQRENDDRIYYCAPMNQVDADDVFVSIRDTINYNIDMEKKVELFQVKVNELQNIFSELDYEELVTIEFKYKKKKKTNAKKQSQKVMAEETTENIVEENNIVNNDEEELVEKHNENITVEEDLANFVG